MRISSSKHIVLAAALLLAPACDSPTEIEEQPIVTHTVNTETAWGYVALGSSVTPVAVTDPAASPLWDPGFNRTSVRVNSGTGGPGTVQVYCICQNNVDAMTPQQILSMTPEGELADFTSVTSSSIPTSQAAWSTPADQAGAGIFASKPWHKYNLAGDNVISPTFQVYLVKDGADIYKLQVIGYYSATGTARHITFRYARL